LWSTTAVSSTFFPNELAEDAGYPSGSSFLGNLWTSCFKKKLLRESYDLSFTTPEIANRS
jgi:hypothetical protein